VRSWDIETGTRAKLKRKASPFNAGNHVVVHAWKDLAQPKVHVRYFGRTPPKPGWLGEVLEGTKLLAGFNIKFDLLHALQCPVNLGLWMGWVANGGQVWDCQLAEYLLNGMGRADHMLSMDEVAPRYGGSLKVDEVKALWAAGVQTEDIDPGLLERYLAGGPDEDGVEQPGDIGNTEAIALAQIRRAREAGQLKSIMLNMGALLFSVEAERNGMYVDMELGLKLAEELQARVQELSAKLNSFLPELPEGFEFKWSSRHHKSALIFGGTIHYPRREWQLADGSWTFEAPPPADMVGSSLHPEFAYAQKDETHYVLEDGTTAECSWWEHCRDTEWQGNPPPGKDRAVFKGGKNAGEPKTKKVKAPDYSKPKSRMGTGKFTFPGFTRPKPEWETSEPGVYSVNDEIIEELGSRNIPFLNALAELQATTKDLGTYFIVRDESGGAKGMLSLVDTDGVVHHKINHNSTVTGRMSSSDPTLQNLPKGSKSDVKRVFVSRFGPDGKIVQSDYKSLEVYVQAILTECKQLVADLKAGLDMHVKRLALKEGMPYDEVLKLCKGDGNTPPDPEWDKKRTAAKVISFQRAYGAGAPKIAASTGLPVEDIAAMILAEDEEYPEIEEYYRALTRTLEENRRPTGRAIPHPEAKGVMCHLGESTFRTPDGKLYKYQEQPVPEFALKRGKTSGFSPTEIKNYVVQGTGGEWMKAAMWLLVRAFYARKNFDGKALLVNTVHDSAMADVHPDVASEAAALIHACMEAASDLMAWHFSWDIALPVPSDTTWGQSMIEELPIPGINSRAAELRAELRATYMKGFVPNYLKGIQ
jgi:DNA polymerase I-like protein with 3'-5' exonuclease and polymerase domains